MIHTAEPMESRRRGAARIYRRRDDRKSYDSDRRLIVEHGVAVDERVVQALAEPCRRLAREPATVDRRTLETLELMQEDRHTTSGSAIFGEH